MGTWGWKLSESDTFCEVKETFYKEKRNGQPIESIALSLRENYCDIENPERHLAILAIGECLWENNAMLPSIRGEIDSIIADRIDEKYCISCGASASFLDKRKREIEKYIKKIANDDYSAIHQSTIVTVKKGDFYRYKSNGKVYGAVVLETMEEYGFYLIAISDEVVSPTITIETIQSTGVYTVAWFSSEELLSPRRLHLIGQTEISKSYKNKLGLHTSETEVNCTNVGQSFTWKHEFRSYYLKDSKILDYTN